MAKRLRPPVDQPAAVITARATAAAATAQTRESHMADLAALRADHPGLLALEAWLRATSWRPEPTADVPGQETKETR